MFQSARLTLTGWYLLIIMVISILFSMAFYRVATSEIERIITRMEFRREHPFDEMPFRLPKAVIVNNLEELESAKQLLFTTLVVINGGIFMFAGAAGYFLAGRTLRPIQLMIDEQHQFITNASHELRTPIATMRAEMEGSLLEKRITDQIARKLIQSNLEELTRLQELSNNLLRLAQIHTVDTDVFMEKLHIKDILVSSQQKVKSLAKQKKIVIQSTMDDQLITGNKERLVELFVILLDNAIKYSHQQSTIHLRSVTKDTSLIVTISDEGIGIPKKDLPHIFDRFYRADKSRSQADGYGLGLSIAKKIADIHGISIDVESKETKGSTFSVTLPILSLS